MKELWPPQSFIPGQQTPYPLGKREAIEHALTEAWVWLERQGLIVPAADTNRTNGWRVLSRKATRLETIADLAQSVGRNVLPAEMTIIAESRLRELRKLVSSDFDFRKLIRLCEEINSSYAAGNYFATAMLTRGLLDHVPPVFGKKTFAEVVNNYGAKSFKGTMQHLDSGIRNVADGHLHGQIRKKETLPEPQQVDFRAGLDVLLGEIARIIESKEHDN
jgi:hypothetical protein